MSDAEARLLDLGVKASHANWVQENFITEDTEQIAADANQNLNALSVDLAKKDFPLVGGRIDVIAENPVPSLVYAHRKHLISLTAVPDSGHANSQPVLSVVNGYNVYRWTED